MTEFDERESILRRASAKAYIDLYQHKLGLMDWEIRYSPCSDEDDMASVHFRLPEKAAQIGIDQDVPVEMIETLVIHELIHLVMKPLTVMLESLIAKQKDDTFRDYLADELETAEETVIEALTRALGGDRFQAYGDLMEHFEAWA